MLLPVVFILLVKWGCIIGKFCNSKDDCRQLEFKPAYTFDGKRLKNRMIRTEDIMDAGFCETLCYMDPNCVSYNLKKAASSNGKYRCELNNATFEGQQDNLEQHSEYLYRGAKNACLKNSCQNNAICQTGFTDKGYRCLCTEEFKGTYCSQGYSSCLQIFNNFKTQENKDYLLEMTSGKIRVYCHMSSHGLGTCEGGGWTLVMKIDGHKLTFHYRSALWSNNKEFNVTAGKILLDNNETKLPTYWNTPFSKICLGMKIGDQTSFILIAKKASSMHALIADGKYRHTSLGPEAWRSLIGSDGSLQRNCNREGFNAACSQQHSKARIGIISNNEDDCDRCDSRIGFGTGGKHDDTNTCGNEVSYNGLFADRHMKAMGYILVQ